MTKTFLTLLCCAISAAGAWAQLTSPNANSTETQHRKRVQHIINRQVQSRQSGAMQKTTTGGQQLQNMINTIYNQTLDSFYLIDSVAFKWSGNREMAHYHNPFDIAPDVNDMNYITPETPLSMRAEVKLPADSALLYQRYDADTFFVGTISSDYGINNRLLARRFIRGYTATPVIYNNHYQLNYDALGHITSVNEYSDIDTGPGLNLQPGYTLYCKYNAAGWLVQDSLENYGSAAGYDLTNYRKDAAGKDTCVVQYSVLAGVTEQRDSTVYQYTSSGLLWQSARYEPFNGVFYSALKDSFGYSGTSAYPNYEQYYYVSLPDDIIYGAQLYYTLNANDDVTERLHLYYNDVYSRWDTGTFTRYYYNANANPDSTVQDTWNLNSTWVPRTLVYEYRYAPTAIKDVAAVRSISMSVYPNPARDVLTLQLPQDANGTLSMYDAGGRLVRQYTYVQHGMKLDVGKLPIGVYIVQYRGSDGSVGTARFVKE